MRDPRFHPIWNTLTAIIIPSVLILTIASPAAATPWQRPRGDYASRQQRHDIGLWPGNLRHGATMNDPEETEPTKTRGEVDPNAVNPDRAEKWAFASPAPLGFSARVIGADGTIYLGTQNNKFYAIGSPVPVKLKINPTSVNFGAVNPGTWLLPPHCVMAAVQTKRRIFRNLVHRRKQPEEQQDEARNYCANGWNRRSKQSFPRIERL